MPLKIATMVRAEVSREMLELSVSGCLTDITQRILSHQIDKALTLDSAAVDLTAVRHIECVALQNSRFAVASEAACAVHVEDPVRFRLPQMPQHGPWGDELGEVSA